MISQPRDQSGSAEATAQGTGDTHRSGDVFSLSSSVTKKLPISKRIENHLVVRS